MLQSIIQTLDCVFCIPYLKSFKVLQLAGEMVLRPGLRIGFTCALCQCHSDFQNVLELRFLFLNLGYRQTMVCRAFFMRGPILFHFDHFLLPGVLELSGQCKALFCNVTAHYSCL